MQSFADPISSYFHYMSCPLRARHENPEREEDVNRRHSASCSVKAVLDTTLRLSIS